MSTDSAIRPNFLVVVLDDVRFDDLGFAGHPFVQTPSFDRVANEGVQFTNAFAAIPLCSPNRASILTGQYPHSHGIIDNSDRSPRSHQLLTFPRFLRRVGYETAFFGKWHMGLDDSPRPGFDEWLSFRGQGTYFDPPVNDNGQRRELKGYASDLFSDRVAEFIRRRARPAILGLPLAQGRPPRTLPGSRWHHPTRPGRRRVQAAPEAPPLVRRRTCAPPPEHTLVRSGKARIAAKNSRRPAAGPGYWNA